MVFGTQASNSYDGESDEIRDIKNHIKLVELDLEKRIVLLENSINAIHKSMGGIQQFDASKDAVMQIQEIKNTLREIEDTSLISKLDTINNGDKLAIIYENISALNGKIKLLSDAVDILGEGRPNSAQSAETNNDLSSIKSDISSLKGAVSKISSSIPDPEKIAEISGQINSLEKANAAINEDIKKTYEIHHEKIGLLERRISSLQIPPAVAAKDNSREISDIRGEIEKLKGVNKKLIEMIETDSRTLHELKGIQSEGETYKKITSAIGAMETKISGMEREMSLSQATYPENLMKLEKEFAEIKSRIADFANIVKSIEPHLEKRKEKGSDTDALKKQILSVNSELSSKINELESAIQKLAGETNNKGIQDMHIQGQGQKNLRAIEDSITNISIKLAESASLKGKVAALENDIRNIKEAVAEIGALKNELTLSKKTAPKIIREVAPPNNQGQPQEKSGKSIDTEAVESVLKMIKLLSDDYKGIKKDVEQLKHICAEIIKENQQQPIIID